MFELRLILCMIISMTDSVRATMVVASIIILLSWVFVEAEAVAEDNALIP